MCGSMRGGGGGCVGSEDVEVVGCVWQGREGGWVLYKKKRWRWRWYNSRGGRGGGGIIAEEVEVAVVL